MSKAIKCDRCGNFDVPRYDAKVRIRDMNNMSISVRYDWGSAMNTTKTDLCAKCIESLAAWWERGRHVPA